METFVVYALNTATREKDPSKITTFGPLAIALWRILYYRGAENKRPRELDTVGWFYNYTSVYRGLKLS